MSKIVPESELVIGQRYWLDEMKDVHAVYVGKCSQNGSTLFNDAIYNDEHPGKYLPRDNNGTLGFLNWPEFTWETYDDGPAIPEVTQTKQIL